MMMKSIARRIEQLVDLEIQQRAESGPDSLAIRVVRSSRVMNPHRRDPSLIPQGDLSRLSTSCVRPGGIDLELAEG